MKKQIKLILVLASIIMLLVFSVVKLHVSNGDETIVLFKSEVLNESEKSDDEGTCVTFTLYSTKIEATLEWDRGLALIIKLLKILKSII